MYNTTGILGSGNFWQLSKGMNDATGQIFFTLLICGVFIIILFVTLRTNEFLDSLMISSWLSFLLSIMLVIAQLLNIKFMFLWLVIAAFATLYKYLTD